MINPPASNYNMFELFSLQPMNVSNEIIPVDNLNIVSIDEPVNIVKPDHLQSTTWKKYGTFIVGSSLILIVACAFYYRYNKKKKNFATD